MLKKVFLVGLMLAVVPAAVFALSIDGTQTQGKGTFALGLGSEYLIEREMVLKLNPTSNVVTSPKLRDLYRIYARPSFGLMDGVDVYAKFGLTDFEGRELSNGLKREWDAEQAFLSGAGAKVSYEITDGIIWGCDVGFTYSKNKTKYEGTPEITKMYEWHVAPYVGKLIGNFVPYVGVKYDDLRMTERVSGTIYKYRAKSQFGVFVGLDYGIGEKICLNAEGRFVDETGVSLSANYRF